jgi:hypothetical protein
MQSGTDVGGASSGGAGEGTLDVEDDSIPSASTGMTSLMTPCSELGSRRRSKWDSHPADVSAWIFFVFLASPSD